MHRFPSGAIISSNYRCGAFIAHMLGEERKQIYLSSRKFLEYNNADHNIFCENSIEESSVDSVSVIQNIPDYSCQTTVISSLNDIILDGYNFVCADSDIESFVRPGLSYIGEEKFIGSFEGNMWAKIFQPKFYSSNLSSNCASNCAFNWPSSWLDEIELHQTYKVNRYNCLPYIQHSELKDNAFVKTVEDLIVRACWVELFKMLTHQDPLWQPGPDVQENVKFLKEAVILQKLIIGQKYLIDKTLAQYVNEPVLYIGKEPVRGVTKQFVYEPKCVGYATWSRKIVETSVNSLREAKLALTGQSSRLKASNLHLRVHEPSLHSYVKKMAVKEISAILDKKPIDHSWKNYLQRSGVEYIKILNRAQALVDNFLQWYGEHNVQNYVFEYTKGDVFIGFYSKNAAGEVCIANFVWTMPSKSSIYHQSPDLAEIAKLFASSLASFALISPFKVMELDVDLFDERLLIAPGQRAKEDDLFYWN